MDKIKKRKPYSNEKKQELLNLIPKETRDGIEKNIIETSPLWEKSGTLGHSIESAKVRKKSEPISIRLDPELINNLKICAKDEGFDAYQTYIKTALAKLVKAKLAAIEREHDK